MGTHDARAFHVSLPGGQQGGTLHVLAGSVSWTGEDGGIDMPLDGLRLEIGGASDRIVFFTHPACEGWTLTCNDPRVLDEPALASRPAVAALVKGARRRRRIGWWLVATPFAILVLGIISLVLFRSAIVRGIASQVPVSAETAMGAAAVAGIEASPTHRVLEDAEVDRVLAALAEPLLRGIGTTRYQYRFRIVDDDSINAFAVPGGEVFVHSGLILRADRAEEVMGVLAHEIAHVQERHAMRSLIEKLGLAMLVQLVIGDPTGVQAILVAAGPELLGLKFSRDFELEADASGFRYLRDAGLDPTGMAAMFRKLEQDHAEMAGTLEGAADALSLLSTHPPARERFEALDAMAAEGAGGPPSATLTVDFAAFQERLRSLAADGGP